MKVKFEDMVSEFKRILIKKGFNEENASVAAAIFAQSSADGIYSHGVNRFPRIISYIEKGYIKVNQKPTLENSFGAFERWNGNLGLGNLNAKICMDRACEIAKENCIGIVALKNTNHWLRGGTYGWQAADNGYIGICWTNTMPNMPAWGAKDRRIGNNPFIISIPRSGGNHVVIDCAVSQFSYGKIEECKLKGIELPVVGGFDTNGDMTKNPAEIEKTWRVLPMGFWKGSGLSIALDLVAAILSGGNSVTDIGRQGEDEYGLSQIFIAINPNNIDTKQTMNYIINNVIDDVKASELDDNTKEIRYPGEREFRIRQENMKNGIPVIDEVWKSILEM